MKIKTILLMTILIQSFTQATDLGINAKESQRNACKDNKSSIKIQNEVIKILNSTDESEAECADNKLLNEKIHNIAENAVIEAQSAQSSQKSAGQQSAHIVKEELALKAQHAAEVANTAFLGKEEAFRQLKHQLKFAEEEAQEEASMLQFTQSYAAAAIKAAQQSQALVSMLAQVLKMAEAVVHQSAEVAECSRQELAARRRLEDVEKGRLERLMNRYRLSKEELSNTKEEATKAEIAAQQAKQIAANEKRSYLRKHRRIK